MAHNTIFHISSFIFNLCIQIELFDWKLEDLTKTNDGGILRQTLKVGSGYSSPNEEALVESTLH